MDMSKEVVSAVRCSTRLLLKKERKVNLNSTAKLIPKCSNLMKKTDQVSRRPSINAKKTIAYDVVNPKKILNRIDSFGLNCCERKRTGGPIDVKMKTTKTVSFGANEVREVPFYDRTTLKPSVKEDIADIHKELNTFKETEMKVHKASRSLTRYH